MSFETKNQTPPPNQLKSLEQQPVFPPTAVLVRTPSQQWPPILVIKCEQINYFTILFFVAVAIASGDYDDTVISN